MRDRCTAEEESQYIKDQAHHYQFIEQRGCRSVLDFGCGPGWFLNGLSPLFRSKSLPSLKRIAGVEVSPRCLRECTARGMPVYETWPDGHWDLVRCAHVIEHLEAPVHWIKTAREKSDLLILETPDFGGVSARKYGERYRMLHDPTHISLFTLESMHRFLRDHNWRIVDVQFPFSARYAADLPKFMGVHSAAFPGNWMTFFCE